MHTRFLVYCGDQNGYDNGLIVAFLSTFFSILGWRCGRFYGNFYVRLLSLSVKSGVEDEIDERRRPRDAQKAVETGDTRLVLPAGPEHMEG